MMFLLLRRTTDDDRAGLIAQRREGALRAQVHDPFAQAVHEAVAVDHVASSACDSIGSAP